MIRSFTRITRLLFGSNDDEEDNDGPPTVPLIPQNDTVIAIHGGHHPHHDDDSGTSYSEEYSGFGDDDGGTSVRDTRRKKHPEYYAAGKEGRNWIEHIIKETKDTYEEPREMISKVFNLFCREYPYDALNMGALEYIREDNDYNHVAVQQGKFKNIFYNTLSHSSFSRKESCKIPLEGVSGVFLVNKHLDYVYGRVLETALLHQDRVLSKSAYDAFIERAASVLPCQEEHIQSEKCCPSEWVLYVDVGSQFYRYCSELLKKQIPCINYGINAQYVNAERLSFYLVLFLCGEHMEGCLPLLSAVEPEFSDVVEFQTREYTSINQWKKLPVWFVALYYAGNSAR